MQKTIQEKFNKAYRDAMPSELKVRDYLTKLGFPTKYKSKGTEPDDGDIKVKINGVWSIVEVRHRNYKFKSKDKLFKKPAVDYKQRWDNYSEERKPIAYFNVNKSMSHAYVAYTHDEDKWELTKFKHKITGKPQEAYLIDKAHVSFVKL